MKKEQSYGRTETDKDRSSKQHMKKEQSYGRVLVLLLIACAIYGCYTVVSSGPQKRAGVMHTGKLTNQELRERLGRSTWTLLHTMAAKYPAFPTVQHKRDVLSFLHLLSVVFPCGECTKHFQKLLSDFPPRVSSHDEFKTWMCEAHNIVNRRLGKAVVDCRGVDDVWQCGCEA